MPPVAALAGPGEAVAPLGNPAALRRAAAAWRTEAVRLMDHHDVLSACADELRAEWEGRAASNFQRWHDELAGEIVLGARDMGEVARALEDAANQIEAANAAAQAVVLGPGDPAKGITPAAQLDAISASLEQTLAPIIDLLLSLDPLREAATRAIGGQGRFSPVEIGGAAATNTASYDRTLEYIHNEMVNNSRSGAVADIRTLNDIYNQAAREPSPEGILSGPSQSRLLAMFHWARKVLTGAEWDHKDKIKHMLNVQQNGDNYFRIGGQSNYEIRHDFWSNVHYGYVGRVAGFDAETLQWAHQIRSPFTGFAGNEPGDVTAVQLGIDLYNRYKPGELKPEHLHDAIVAVIPQLIDESNGQMIRETEPGPN